MSEQGKSIYELTEKDIIYESEGDFIEDQLLQGKPIEEVLAKLEDFTRGKMTVERDLDTMMGITAPSQEISGLETTETQRKVIEGIGNGMDVFVRQYGAQESVTDPDRIFLLPKREMQKRFKKDMVDHREVEGICTPDGTIFIQETPDDLLKDALTVTHEVSHKKSFKSPKGIISGISIYNQEDESRYFWAIDEGVTEEITRRFGEQYFQTIEPLFAELKSEKEFLGKPSRNRMEKERETVNRLVDDLYERNKDQFGSREEVFNFFARAVISGEFSNLSNLVDQTYGRGAFAKLGRDTKQSIKNTAEE